MLTTALDLIGTRMPVTDISETTLLLATNQSEESYTP